MSLIFTIQLPSFIQSRLNKSSTDIKGDSMPMVFVLEIVSALILVGFGAGKLLPKAGMWMDNIKYVFGVLLLGVSIYLFSTLSLISPLILWGIYLIGIAIFIGALDSIEAGDKVGKFLKASGIVSLIWGTLLLVGAAYGGHDPTKPLANTAVTYVQNQNTTEATKEKQTFFDIYDMDTLDEKLSLAQDEEKMVILYFNHDVCPVCKHLKETTWIDPKVKSLLSQKYIALSINMSNSSDENINAIKKRFGIFGPPGFVFFDEEGDELKEESFYGYLSPEDMFDTLDLLAE